MKTRSLFRASAAAMLLSLAPSPAPAQTASKFAYDFLMEVGCSQLPMQACTGLDPANALNILKTYQAILVNKHCGTGQIEGAKQLLDVGMALDETRCRRVLQAIGAIR